jgi:hypothetical protein
MKKHSHKSKLNKHSSYESFNVKHRKHIEFDHLGLLRENVESIDQYFKYRMYLNPKNTDQLTALVLEYYRHFENDLQSNLKEIFSDEELKNLEKGEVVISLIDRIIKQTKKIEKLEELPYQIAEIIAKFIELMDLTQLPSIATYSYVESMLNKLDTLLNEVTYVEVDVILNEIVIWKKRISPNLINKLLFRKQEFLPSKLCEQLEIDVVKWIDIFKLKIVNLKNEDV